MGKIKSLDDIAGMLQATGRYRVQRRLPGAETYALIDPEEGSLVGAVLDCEATGVDPERDAVIEIAIIAFAYAPDGRILHVIDYFEGRQQPPGPLSDEVVALTGLTDADLESRTIDVDALAKFLEPVNILIAHSAAYDRAILEANFPTLPPRNWACSLQNIAWRQEGVRDRRLSDLLLATGFFNAGHRALADCESLLKVLESPLPISGRTAFAVLLENARAASVVIFAEGASWAISRDLKARGYRWWPGDPGGRGCWTIEVDARAAPAEIVRLRASVYAGTGGGPTITMLTALNRFRPMAVIARHRVAAPEGGW